jgi:hypothetical protein
MGEFSDRLMRLSVQADSPDRLISGMVGGRMQVEVSLCDGAYRRYTDADLGHQLGQLAAVLWSRYRREYDEVTDAYREDGPAPYEQPEDSDFRERRASLVARGRSRDGRIEASSRGLVRWDVSVTPGTVRALTEAEFLAEVGTAVADILRDWQLKVIVLADEIYGIGVPAYLRQPAETP